jgi:regulator of sigma E protease
MSLHLFLAVAVLGTVAKVALFIGVVCVLVVLHEYGHFILARVNGVRVMEFSVGMGPLLASVRSKRSGTQYSLRALPIGGYCAMHGEDNKVSESEQQREFRQTVVVNGREYDRDNFQAKGPWQRLAIIVAGPAANFILAFFILLAAGFAFGVPTLQQRVGPVKAHMPAQRAGIRQGDVIVSVDGVQVHSGDQLIGLIHSSLGKQIAVGFTRKGLLHVVKLTPAPCPGEPRNGCIGFYPESAYVRAPITATLRDTADNYATIVEQVAGGLVLLVRQPAKYGSQVTGVVGMAQVATTVQSYGWGPYLFFAAVISFALGLFNLLPLPALDGGRAAFIIGELIRGKPVDPEKEAWVHVTGFAVLIVLMVVINFYNAVEIVQGKGPFQ